MVSPWRSDDLHPSVLIPKIMSVLNITFGGTILDSAIRTFVYCIIGSKIDNIQTALTWIHDNANVELPLLNDDALILPSSASNELAAPLASAAVGSGSEGDGGAIGKIFDAYERELLDQRLIALLFCGLYLLIVIIGLLVLLRHTIWPRPDPSDQPETMQEKLLDLPRMGRRHDDQESYFQLEDVPLHPRATSVFSQETASNAGFLANARNQMARFKSSIVGSRSQPGSRPDPSPLGVSLDDPVRPDLGEKMR
jgi:hypothetical protein